MRSTTTATRRLRRRLTMLAVALLAAVLAASGVALLALQRRQMTAAIDDRLAQRADAVEQAAEGGLPALPTSADPEDELTQVVAIGGSVIAATPNLTGAPAVADPPEDHQQIRTVRALPIDDGHFRILSRRVTVDGGAGVLHVAESADDIDDAVGTLALSLLAAFPVVVALLGALTWWLVGRAVRPVDAAAGRQARFVSDASHELRSPLTRIRTRLEVDLAHPDGTDLRTTAAAVLADARSMQHLIDDLLELAMADEAGGSATQHTGLVDLDDIVLAEASAYRATGGVVVDTTQVSAGLVSGNHDELGRVVRNLLDNAARHAAHVVHVTLRESDGWVVLTVDDDGPGIPAGRRAEVFERFTRLDTARTPGGGHTGLGLAIARELTERHGGHITIDDAPIGGARFTLRLPAP